jgi:peptide/nickel transport system substrate-binding protein
VKQRPAFFSLARVSCAIAVLCATAILPAAGQTGQRQLVVVIDQEPSTLDPAFALSQPSTEPLMSNIQDQLVGADHNGRPKMGVATWTIVDDGKIVDFHIRPGVKFTSGDPLTAEDVVFTFERRLEHSANFRGYYKASIDRVEAVNPLTVRFYFKTPNITIVNERSIYLASKAYHDRVGEQTFFDHPVGTGPYKLVDYKRGQYADLEANPNYWGGAPQVKRARIYFIKDDATRAAKLQSGEADLISAAPWSQIAAFQKAGFHIVSAPTFPFVAINFQTYNPSVPWAKLKVRQAIAHAIDGDAIAKGLMNGIPSREPLLSPGELGYDPKLKNYSYDPALSKKLLSEAGFPNGFTMPLFWPQTYYGMRETAQAVALYLKAVGITVNVTQLETIQNQEMLGKSSKDPTFVYNQLRAMPFSNYDDPATALYFTLSNHGTTTTYKPTDPKFEELVDRAVTIFDAGKRAAVIIEADKMLYNDVGIVGIWHAATQFAMKPDVSFTPVAHQLPMMYLKDVKLK